MFLLLLSTPWEYICMKKGWLDLLQMSILEIPLQNKTSNNFLIKILKIHHKSIIILSHTLIHPRYIYIYIYIFIFHIYYLIWKSHFNLFYFLFILSPRYVHLTNYSINKYNENYVANEDNGDEESSSKWSLTAFKVYL